MSAACVVVVPTRNSARTLERCLRSVRAQSVPAELVVVDNLSRDETKSIARAFADRVIEAGPERSAQRNAGARASAAPFLLFADADMYLDPDCVQACLRAYDASKAAVAIPEESVGAGFWASCKRFERAAFCTNSGVAAARFFERELFDRIGGFDESLYAGEDWDISARAERDAGVVFAQTRVLHDEGRLRPLQLWKKKFYYGRGLVAYIRKDPHDARRRLSPARVLRAANARPRATPAIYAGMGLLKLGELLFGAAGLGAGYVALGRRGLRALE